MARPKINPAPDCVQIEAIRPDPAGVTVILRIIRTIVSCPDCEELSDSIHSWYQRTLVDLP